MSGNFSVSLMLPFFLVCSLICSFFSFSLLLGNFFTGMSLEIPRWCKFSQFMAYHELGNIYRDEFIPVMHGKSMPYKIRGNGRTAAPGFDDAFLRLSVIDAQHFYFQVCIYVRTFFY